MKKYIPLCIKSSAAVLVNQFGRLPLGIVLRNIQLSFTENRNSSEAAKRKAVIKAQRATCRYLLRKYGRCMDEICTHNSRGEPAENAPIWVFWWQAALYKPEVVNICIKNLLKNAGNRPVYFLDRENYRDFVDIPEHIDKKLWDGVITVTHFSDYLRMKLLAEHGGLWLDSTVFVKRPVDTSVFQYPVWTVRNPSEEVGNISKWEWAANSIGGWKGNTLFRVIADVLDRYWAEHSMMTTYYLIDCLFRVVFDRYDELRNMVVAVPPSNSHYYYYQETFNLPLDDRDYEEELDSDTWLYKLSWKDKYEEKLPDGRETYYARWKREFGA